MNKRDDEVGGWRLLLLDCWLAGLAAFLFGGIVVVVGTLASVPHDLLVDVAHVVAIVVFVGSFLVMVIVQGGHG